MIIKANDILAPYFDIIDTNTNKKIKLCQWANDKTKKYEVMRTDSDGKIIFNKELDKLETERKKGNIKIIRKYSVLYIFISAIVDITRQIIKIKRIGY